MVGTRGSWLVGWNEGELVGWLVPTNKTRWLLRPC